MQHNKLLYSISHFLSIAAFELKNGKTKKKNKNKKEWIGKDEKWIGVRKENK